MKLKITISSHYTLGNAPHGYMVVRVEIAGMFSIEGERNPHTNGEFRWPSGFTPSKFLTDVLNRFDLALQRANSGQPEPEEAL